MKLRRILSIILSLVMLLGMMPMASAAGEIIASGSCGENLTWTLDSEGTLTISGKGKMLDYDAGISYWYEYRDIIENAVIESGVANICDMAFRDCVNLKTVSIPETVTVIEGNAFQGCESLRSVVIPNSVVSVEGSTFSGCAALESAVLSENISSIDAGIFGGCSSLKSVNIPEGVTYISNNAFQNCSSLESIVIPESVDRIFDQAFRGCTALCSVTMPESMEFSLCAQVFRDCTSLEEIVISGGISEIEGNAFYGCTSLRSVTIPAGVWHIRGGAFENCSSLESIFFPKSVGDIDEWAFSGCENLSKITFTGAAPDIYANAFQGVTATVIYPKGDSTWEGVAGKNYAGSLTWVASDMTCEHVYSDWEIIAEASCYDEGLKKRSCFVCGDNEDVIIPATDHTWDEGYVSAEPSIEVEGVKTYTCTVCSETKTESIPVLEHVHRYTEAVTEPSCDEKGYTGYTCSCGESYKDKYTDALGHKWGKSEITKEPTADAEGEKTYTCTECGDTMTEKLEKLPDCGGKHSWDRGKVSKEPTNKEEGEMRYNCTECGETKTEKIARLPDVDDFKDVAKRDYFYDSVKWALEESITTGTAKDKFSPSALCTRAQIVTFLWRAAGEPVARNTKNPFRDVKEGEYYNDAVLWALENGITGGISKDLFAPDAPCTRAQVVTFLWRAAGEPEPDGNKNPFADVTEGQYYYDAVLWAVEQGITKGLTMSVFGSDASCTRAQIVTFLCRAFTQ